METIINVNAIANFEIVKVHSSKKNKDYYGIAIVLNESRFILKFLTLNQVNAIIDYKKGE